MKFANKKVIITGAAQGIGKALAEAFKAEGATTLLIDINPITYQADFIYQGDLAEESILKDFSEKIITQYGQIDYLINNACYMNGGILSGCTYQDYLTIQNVGVAAPSYLTLPLKDHFAPGAAIVNMTSTRAQHTRCQSSHKNIMLHNDVINVLKTKTYFSAPQRYGHCPATGLQFFIQELQKREVHVTQLSE